MNTFPGRLWLYFSNQRIWGRETHVTSFYVNLPHVDEAKSPHPCLINAMVSPTQNSVIPC